MQVTYNSFSLAFKQPFGAVLCQTPIHFKLNVQANTPIQQVTLCIVHDGQWDAEQVLPLSVSDSTMYTTTFTPTQTGLYFYYFRIQTMKTTAFYGCVDGGYGGLGLRYDRREQVQMY